MNDIDYPQRLREIAEELAMEDSEVDIAVILGAAGLIERLIPKLLTPDEIVDALSAGVFLGATDWECHIDDEIDRPYFTPALSLHVRLELRESQIVARGLSRYAAMAAEKEAGVD